MKKELVAYNEPRSPITENFKTLRTNLQFMNANNKVQVILITSTLPGEGKTWAASNLAVTFAQAGNKVIIVDADMRKGRLFNIFDIPPRPGLSNYLSGVVSSKSSINNIDDPTNFIRETQVENLYAIPSGDVPPNPSELLITPKMIKLIDDLKKLCDVIIIDTPPTVLVADSKILSRLADVSLIVASYKETKMDNLKNAKKDIENVGGKVGGVILNKVPIQVKKYESNGYYGDETSLPIKPNKKKNTIKPKPTLRDERIRQETQRQINKQERIKEPNIYNDDISNIYKEESKPKDEIRTILDANEITIDKSQDILAQINSYLNREKKRMNDNNGEKND